MSFSLLSYYVGRLHRRSRLLTSSVSQPLNLDVRNKDGRAIGGEGGGKERRKKSERSSLSEFFRCFVVFVGCVFGMFSRFVEFIYLCVSFVLFLFWGVLRLFICHS